MTYSKPQITVLGDAAEVIQGGKPSVNTWDGSDFVLPAYELDE